MPIRMSLIINQTTTELFLASILNVLICKWPLTKDDEKLQSFLVHVSIHRSEHHVEAENLFVLQFIVCEMLGVDEKSQTHKVSCY